MIAMIPAKLDVPTVSADLNALDRLLADNDELEETGPGSLQEFFTSRPHLLLLMSRAFCPGLLLVFSYKRLSENKQTRRILWSAQNRLRGNSCARARQFLETSRFDAAIRVAQKIHRDQQPASSLLYLRRTGSGAEGA